MNTRQRPASPESLTAQAQRGPYRYVSVSRAAQAEAATLAWVRRYEEPYWSPLTGKGDDKPARAGPVNERR